MSRGPRSAPPDLPGFTADRWLGGGGFADVFLYTQLRPSRSVAVKILRREHLSAHALAQFDAEADIMAEVSTHPYIVTIFTSGVAPDGRPYIVMEHYPQPNYGERARGGALDISEVLRTGIQVASAVETAHRAGIIHRDIKPANILTSAFGRPGLTDFGISGVQSEGVVSEAIGSTPAYTAPELLNEESTGSVATDVYGLGSTISALAAGHSPFWSPSGDNGEQAVLARALSSQIAPITRSDAPSSLNHLLRQAMDPEPRNRPSSAIALAQSLQQIEQELRLQPTPIEVIQTAESGATSTKTASDPDDKDSTRRSIQVVHPHGIPADTPVAAPRPPVADVPIVAASTPPPAPPLAPRPVTAAPTSAGASFAPGPGAAPGILPHGDTDPTVARGRTAPITSAPPVSAVPPAPRVPAISSRPSPASDPLEDADTVARGRRPGTPAPPFAPPVSRTPAATTATPSTFAPTPPTADAPTATPEPRPPRKPLPWKPIGIAAAILIAIVAVVAVLSMGGRDSKAGPGTNSTPGAPPQPIITGDSGGPVKTPTDIRLENFTLSPDKTSATAALTWTPNKDRAVTDRITIWSMSSGSDSTTLNGPATGKVIVTLSFDASGACTSATAGTQKLPLSFCAAGPPCFSMTSSATDRSSGDPMSASAGDPEHADLPVLATPTMTVTAADYAKACATASPVGN